MFRVFIRVIFGKTRIKTRMKLGEAKILINKEGQEQKIKAAGFVPAAFVLEWVKKAKSMFTD